MKLGFAGLLIGLTLATQVVAKDATDPVLIQQVSQCAAETRAPGSYLVAAADGVPSVLPAEGGSEVGVRNINDCLQDVYDVQYDQVATEFSDVSVDELVARCRTKANVSLVIGTVVTAATFSTIGSVAEFWSLLGASVGGSQLGRGLGYHVRCGQLSDPEVAKSLGIRTSASVCMRSADVMHGGSGYCR